MPDGPEVFLRNTGGYFRRAGAPGNRAGMGLDNYFDEDPNDLLTQAVAATQGENVPSQPVDRFRSNSPQINTVSEQESPSDVSMRSLINPQTYPPGSQEALNEAYRLQAISEGGYGPDLAPITRPEAPLRPIQGPQLDVDSLNIPSFDAPSDMAAGLTGEASFLVDPNTYQTDEMPPEEELAPEAAAPRSFLERLGGGIKKALTSPGVSDALIATGTRVMSEGFGGLGQGLREGVAELEEGRQERKYTDTIQDLGKYLSEEERQIALAMPEGEGFAYLREKMEGAEGKAARARALVEILGMTPEAAAIMAVDPAASDRAMAGGRQVEMIKDDAGQSYLINTATGEQVAGPFGTEVPNLDRERLELGYAQLEATNRARYLQPMFDDVIETYANVRPLVDGAGQIAEAIDLLSNDSLQTGTFEGWKTSIDKLLNTEGADLATNLQNILQDIGISNLGRFKGSISNTELKTALEQAGTIEALKATLNDILARNLESRIPQGVALQNKANRLVSEGVAVASQYGVDQEQLDQMRETAQVARSRGGGSVLAADTGGQTRTMQLPRTR